MLITSDSKRYSQLQVHNRGRHHKDSVGVINIVALLTSSRAESQFS